MRKIAGKRRPPVDYKLLGVVLALLAFGWMTLCSASPFLAEKLTSDPNFFIKRQLVWIILGLTLMTVLCRFNYNRWREWVKPLLVVTGTALVAVLFATPVRGATRWIHLGGFSLQPAEFAKITLVIFMADYLDRKSSKLSSLTYGVVVPWLVMGAMILLIALERDLGTPALIFMVGSLLLFIGGTRPAHLAGSAACVAPVALFEILRVEYRRRRLLAFLQPFDSAFRESYQLRQALTAVGSGGWLGKGLGASKLKLLYLPDSHTDFIFPILCEELGLLGALAMLGLFAAFLLLGLRIAKRAPDLFGSLLAAGLTLLICVQAFFNVSVSIGLLPTKGIPLPFFSYGGSSMLVTLAAAGILLNISRFAQNPQPVHKR